jgi:nucleotide-binding universal stress UspA family protein
MVMPRQEQVVLVGVDGSRDGLIALDWAVDHAERQHCGVHVVHVVDDELATQPVPPSEWSSSYDDGTEILHDAADEISRLGRAVDSRLEIRHGRPAATLLELSHRNGLLVIGRRGAEGFAELAVGSTSQVCAALAESTVVVVPDCWQPEAPPTGRVVIGVDGSAQCQAALDFGFMAASLHGATVRVVYAVQVPESFPPPDLWPDPERPAWWADDAELLVSESLAGWSSKYPDVPVETRYVAGHPVQVLAAESTKADLIVVGGVGRSRFTPLLLGSVARGLLHHTASPVAIVHVSNGR